MGEQKATWPSDVVERLRALDSVPSMLDEVERILEERAPRYEITWPTHVSKETGVPMIYQSATLRELLGATP